MIYCLMKQVLPRNSGEIFGVVFCRKVFYSIGETVAPTESQFTLNDALFEELVRKHSESTNVLDMVAPPISINKLHLKTLADRGLSFVSVLYLSFLQSEAEYQDLRSVVTGRLGLMQLKSMFFIQLCCLGDNRKELLPN